MEDGTGALPVTSRFRLLTATLLTSLLAAGVQAPAAATASWRDTVGLVRALGGLDGVAEDATWRVGAQAHSDYMARHGELRHDEDPGTAGYSAAGSLSGRSANIAYGQRDVPSVVLAWLASPAHAFWLLNPAADRMALGHAADDVGVDWWTLQAFDRSGWVDLGVPATGGVLWPSEGAVVPELRADLSSVACGASRGGTVVYWRSQTAPTGATMRVDGRTVETCVLEQQPGWHVIAALEPTPGGSQVAVDLHGTGLRTRHFEVAQGLGAAVAPVRPAPVARSIAGSCPDGQTAPFSDVSGVFARTVTCVGARSLAAGFPDGTFRPTSPLKVGQTFAFTARLLTTAGIERPQVAASTSGGTFDADAAWLASLGVVDVRTTTQLTAPMTRGQMAALVRSAAVLAGAGDPVADEDWFEDDDAHEHADAIAWVAGHGIVLGTAPGTFDPDAPLTRGQMATFLARALALLEDL